MVRRIFVEKKPEFAAPAQNLFEDLKQSLSLEGLKSVRIINRYDVEGLDQDSYNMAIDTIFAEPAIDKVTEETLELDEAAIFFGVEYLPGQFDQRADSAVQCISLMKPGLVAKVKYAKIIVLEGDITFEQVEKVKDYIVNPVDSQMASMEKPETLEMEVVTPSDVEILDGFRKLSEEELNRFADEMALAMSYQDLAHVQKYFSQREDRDPTITELKVIDTYWSDHCRHTTFNTELTDIYFEEGPYADMVKEAFTEYMDMRKEVYGDKKKPLTLMDMACIGTKYLNKEGKIPDLDQSEEINACSIKVKATVNGQEEDWLVMFKNETHNHPTEIEPFGGAATCLGGAIRDPLSGRSYVYQAMRVTGSGDPTVDISTTMEGKLPQRKITREAAQGYSSYGNQIGLATGHVDEVYHPGYLAKRMEVGAVIGAAPEANVVRERPQPGDIIILVGGRTGRDGCGGATGSSKEHTAESIFECGAEVQKGNPTIERNIQRLFRRKEVATLIKRCNDFGAGGVSVAIGELADGLVVDLDLVPKKYEGLDGTELAISESQERMAVVVRPSDKDLFISLAQGENLEATAVATVTLEPRVKMMWRGKCILDLARDFLETNGATQRATVKVVEYGDLDSIFLPDYQDYREYLKDLNHCSKKGLIDQFDSTIGAATVLMPLGGKYQLSPAMGMAAKLPVTDGETDTATLMAYGFDPKLATDSPYHGALNAVVDSVTKIVAMGGDRKTVRLSFQEYFEKLTDDKAWGKPMMALLGGLKAQKELEIPAIGGKDSMSGTFLDITVPPALISFAVTAVDANHVISTEWKKPGTSLILVKSQRDSKGVIDFEGYKSNMDSVTALIKEGHILSACALNRGGLFMAAVKMAVGNKIGGHIDVAGAPYLNQICYGDLLIEVPKKWASQILEQNKDWIQVGRTTDQLSIKIEGVDGQCDKITLKEIIKEWEGPLESVFPAGISHRDKGTLVEICPPKDRIVAGPKTSFAKPKVLIPTFPGTNCEMDSLRAFQRAGAQGEIFIIGNRTTHDLNQSIETLAKKIRESQIIMLPGGFSGGDEPDGSAKFITAIFRSDLVRSAVADLMDVRDGLMLGICNGFQALIKLGLVPFGQITDPKEDSPTLTYNQIGRHQSFLVNTRVASTKSPWLANCQVGQINQVAISHGEGNFIASHLILEQLKAGGQVATQYVDLEGNPSMDIRYNPNFSKLAIEGITSPDGRIFGKMGHVERVGRNLYKNVPGNFDTGIFQAGVSYFK